MARQGLGDYGSSLGRGAKQKWQEADLQTVEQWIEQDARTYSHQLAQKLSEQRQVKLSQGDCDTFYKKGLWMETNSSQPPRQARP